MKKVIAKALVLVSVLSFAVVYSPTTLQVDVVSAATGQTTTPAKKPAKKPAKTTGVPTPQITTGTRVYVVVKGDKMWKIAQKHNLTLAQLAAFNPQIKNLNLIYVGQKIIVGQAASTPAKPTTPVTPATPVVPTIPVVPGTGADAVSAASVTDDAAVFEKAIGKDGKWIICTTKDLVVKNPLVLEGTFKNGKKNADGTDAIQRKIGLYTQDDKRNITARFTLTAPKLTILSPMASIQHGTFIGDLYVSAENFQLVDTKVEGNVYFTSEKARDTFKADDKSSVTGKQELITDVDAVSAASVTDDAAVFEESIGKDGKWIICTTKDLTVKNPLALEGTFKNGKKNADGTDAIQRKIGLYTQDDKRNITNRFTLTAPKLTILSPMASIQHGTFKGDLYVSAENFQLVDTKVEGNVYFTSEKAKATFKADDKSSITGKQELLQVDAVTTASVVETSTAFKSAISKNGKWIICPLNDLVFNQNLVLEGTFKNGKKNADGTDAIQRKIGLYTQDDKRNITNRFTLTAPKLTILSPMASIQHGTFIGDLYVSAENFQLVDTKVEGNVYFTSEKAKTTFKADDKSSITGEQIVIK